MNKLNKALSDLKKEGRMGIMAHIVAGYPNLEKSQKIALAILNQADILEIQLPFSDPIADGPVIAAANEVALKNGTRIKTALKMIEWMVQKKQKPILVMTYFNIILNFGVDPFCKKASEIGIEGIIVPDYPFDEEKGNGLIAACRKNGLAWIAVIAPTTDSKRMKQILKHGSGFIYAMARRGTTGEKTVIDNKVKSYLKQIRKETKIPIALGFGINSREQIEAISGSAEITVIGSALMKEYQDKPIKEAIKAVSKFLQPLAIQSNLS